MKKKRKNTEFHKKTITTDPNSQFIPLINISDSIFFFVCKNKTFIFFLTPTHPNPKISIEIFSKHSYGMLLQIDFSRNILINLHKHPNPPKYIHKDFDYRKIIPNYCIGCVFLTLCHAIEIKKKSKIIQIELQAACRCRCRRQQKLHCEEEIEARRMHAWCLVYINSNHCLER